jgi:hypothetical protein
MSGPLRNLAYIDGYRLFDKLRDGDPVTFTVGGSPVTYTAQFQGKKIGAENYLEVTDGSEVRKWGWGWELETVFHALHDLESDRFLNQSFPFRPATEPGEDGDW